MNLLLRRREMMQRDTEQYVDIFKNTFPADGIVDNRNNMYIYTKEAVPAGTQIHLSFNVSNIPNTVTYINVGQATTDNAAYRVASFSPPFDIVDVEFTTTRNCTFFSVFFSENVTNVPVTAIKLEKII